MTKGCIKTTQKNVILSRLTSKHENKQDKNVKKFLVKINVLHNQGYGYTNENILKVPTSYFFFFNNQFQNLKGKNPLKIREFFDYKLTQITFTYVYICKVILKYYVQIRLYN